MAAYRADIEIGVRGARSLEQLRSSINQTARAVDSLNDVVSARGSLVQNIQNYTNNLNRAARSLELVSAGTAAETKAVREYVQALGEANAARARQNSLVAQELANQRRVTPGNAGVGQQGPALPPALIRAQQVQQNWNRFFQEAAEVAQELQSSAAAKTTNLKTNWNRFFQEAAEVAQELQSSAAAKSVNIRNNWNSFFQEAQELAVDLAAQAQRAAAEIRRSEGAASTAARARLATEAERRARLAGTQAYAFPAGPNVRSGRKFAAFGEVSADVAERALIEKEKRALFEQEKRQLVEIDRLRAANVQKETARYKDLGKAISGSLSSAAIGGAFPLLFGQSPQAAVGGAIGGLLGGAGGGFAGSLIGTALGDLAAAQSAVTELGKELGFSEAQATALSEAFRQAGRDGDKLDSAIRNIQGIGLSTDETASAVKLVTELTDEYGGKVDKVTQALANALESGKVSITTLNSFTAQGIPIQEKLAEKYGVSRDKLLQLTKDGKVSVQDLVDELLEIGRAAEATAGKSETAFEKFKRSVEALSTAVANVATALLRILAPALDTILTKITAGINGLNTLLQAGAGRQLGLAGLSFTFGATSQGVDNIRGALEAISGVNPQSVKEVNTLLRNLDDASRNLRRIGPSDPNAERAVQLQGQILKQRERLLVIQRSLGGGAAPGIGAITAPAQLPPSAGKTGAKPPEDRTADLLDDLNAMRLISTTQDGIRDALFEGNKELAIRLEYDQKVYDIQRDTSKALRDANYETEKAVIRAQEIVRLKDAQLERDDELRDLARRINEIITNTLDDLRGGISWDDTGMREIFDMRIPDAIRDIKENIQDLVDPTNQIIGAATAIGDAFSASFTDIVSGAVSAQQGLANFFKNVGSYFIDMAAQIAAEALKLQAISILQSLLSPLLGSGFGVGSMSLPGLEGAGALSTGNLFQYGAFAEGGFVTGPTRAVIGEGGEAEYVIPASKMRGAMSRYASGARGSAVIPAGGDTESGGTATMAPASIDVRYTVERINSVDYVTADQFQAGLQQAAAQGAERGQQLALRRLQQSPSTRRRVGI